MMWRSELTMFGWRVVTGNELVGECSMRPNQFGRVVSYSYSKGGPNPGFAAIAEACAAARKCLPPGPTGRYGYCSSPKRGQLCELVASALNDRERPA